jgi:hypothetical protein
MADVSHAEPESQSLPGLLRALLRDPYWRFAFCAAPVVCVAGAFWFGHTRDTRIAYGVGIAIVLIVMLYFKLANDFASTETIGLIAGWGRAHGLTFDEAPDVGRGTPLLRDGDVQFAEDGLVGTQLGSPLLLCHYTYTVSAHTDEGGTAYARFTLVRFRNVGSPVGRLTLHPVPHGDPARLWHRQAIASDRLVELESVDFHRLYKLEADHDTSRAAVLQIFEPSFIAWCVDERDVLFEIEDGELVVALRDHLQEPHDLDDLLARSGWVLKQVLAAAHRDPGPVAP